MERALRLGGLDLAVVVLYLVGIVGLGLLAWRKRRARTGSSAEYFLAGGTLGWGIIGLALFSTNISTIHLVSLAQEGYVNGLAYGNFEWMAAFLLIVLSFFFAPFYIRSRVATLPDFLEKRYSRASRDWLAVLSIFSAVFIHIGFSLYTGAVVLKGMFGIDIGVSIVATAVLTGLYTIVGGLLAVVLTESVQTVILIAGAACVVLFGLLQTGGWSGLAATVEPVKLTVLRTAAETPTLPWYAVLLGYPIIGLWYWCADQTIVQRVLGAKDENHARTGPLFCALIKVLPVFIFVLPGLLFYVIIKQNMLPGVTVPTSKEVYGIMIKSLLPAGVFGVMAAALMAALMGNLASAANSISTLFSYDLWKRFSPHTPDDRLVRIGRGATFLSFVAGIALVPLLDRYESIFAGINDVIAHIAPPITCVFLVGIFWPAASARSAKWTMWLGSALGALLFTLKTLHKWKPEVFGWIPSFFYATPFMMMAFYMLVACVGIQIAFTLACPKQPDEDQEKLFWAHPFDALKSPGWPGLANYKVLSAAVFLAMVALYVVFR